MSVSHHSLSVETRGKGLYEITSLVREAIGSGTISNGLVAVFCRHTSCSLVIMENADPTAADDLERYLDELVPDGTGYQHTAEGPDDMPSHIKMALTRTTETVPLVDGRLALGTWQGIFLWEHRSHPHRRSLVVSVSG
ncbi:MAG: secondary thiamine-phosphate synthase enzyme YjbQ [Verrucomicrobiota bacterium]